MKTKTTVSFVILLLILTINSADSQWQQTSLNSGNVRALTRDANFIYAAKTTIYVSSDNGTNWNSIGPGASIQDICLNGDNIFVATQNAGLYRTTNFGANWFQYSMGADGVRSVVSSGNNVYAGQQNYGLMMSSNNGMNWSIVQSVSGSIPSLASNGNNIFAGTYGVYRSTNNGINWSQTLSIPNLVYSIAVNGNTIYAGSDISGVYLSADNGSTWVQTSLNNRTVISLAVSGNNIFAGTFDHGIYFSADNGGSWIQINEGLTSLDVESLLINGNYIYAGTYGGGLFRRNLQEVLAIQNISTEIPEEYALYQNYPNPFNPVTKIKFSLPVKGFTTLYIFDIEGKLVSTLVSEELNAGTYSADFIASNIASGIYFYVISSSNYNKTMKMMLIK